MSLYKEMLADFDPLSREVGDQLLPTSVDTRYRRRDKEDAIAAGRADKAAAIDPRSGRSAWGDMMVRGAIGDGIMPSYTEILGRTRAIAATVNPDRVAVARELDQIHDL